ncbi:MAG: hypothetical protein ABID38_06780, partial [Candidatus Diapherotrites archaeon]
MEFFFLKDLSRIRPRFNNFVNQLAEVDPKKWPKETILKELKGTYDCLVAVEKGKLQGFVSFNRDRENGNTLRAFGWFDLARYFSDKLAESERSGSKREIAKYRRELEQVGGKPKPSKNPLSFKLARKIFELARREGFKSIQMGETDKPTKKMLEIVSRNKGRFDVSKDVEVIPERRRIEFPGFKSAAIVLGCYALPGEKLP